MSCPTDPQPLYSSKPGAGWAGTVPPPQRIVGVRTYTYVITYRARGFHPLSSADGNDFFFPLGIAHMGGRVHGADRVLRRVRPEAVAGGRPSCETRRMAGGVGMAAAPVGTWKDAPTQRLDLFFIHPTPPPRCLCCAVCGVRARPLGGDASLDRHVNCGL